MQSEMCCFCDNDARQHSLELGPGFKPLHVRLASVQKQQIPVQLHEPVQTARRLRPLARRAAITARPPRVFMRVKKPWVRARFTLEGWYVRFMINPVGPHGPVTKLSAVKLQLVIRLILV